MTTPSSLNLIKNDVEEEEDGDSWIPLQEEPSEEPVVATMRNPQEQPPTSFLHETQMTSTTTSTTDFSRHSDAYYEPVDLRILQRKLETSTKLKQGLVDHPLDQAWQRFVVHLGRELWQLDLSLRFGVVLVIFGTIFQSIAMAVFFPWYDPRSIVLVLLFGVSWFYLMPTLNLDDPFQAFASLMHVHRLTATQIRVVFVVCYLVPTWLEMRTLGFLSQVLVQAGWGYNLFVTTCVCCVVVYQRKKQPFLSPRQHFYAAIYVLYGGALWISLLHFRISNIPKTAGPFLLSSGTLLLSRADQRQYTRALRHALRLTLRDTLTKLSGNVQQDEMLQLAMLRWIVDYWSTRPAEQEGGFPSASTQSSSSSNSRATTAPSSARVQPETLGMQDTVMTSEAPVMLAPTINQTRPSASRRQEPTSTEEIRWNDLLPMLDITASQMEEETCHTPHSDENDSVKNFRHMLTSMDVDEHAKPAVEAYKQLVKNFPPSRETALVLSVIKRCPATLILTWRFLMASVLAIPSTFILTPFVVIEIHRVLRWAEACHRSVATEEETENLTLSVRTVTSIPTTLDVMSLLLSPDNYSPLRPPTLLQVWFNVQGSVQALEAGLTAARCAQTTVAAAEFADHVMSLAHLGFEVSQKGWIHGLGIMAQELIHLRVDSREGRYTSAARGALKNSQTMARNVHILVEEDTPIAGFLQAIVKRVWLQGYEEHEPPIPESTVVITELKDGEPDKVGELEQETAANASTRYDAPVVQTVLDAEALEITELVSNAPRRGLISETEKTSCTQTVKDELDERGVDSVKLFSTRILEEEEERNITHRAHVDEVSEAIEMTADTYERGLISETEKNSLMEILAGNTGTNAVVRVKKSLTLVLQEEEAQIRGEMACSRDTTNEVKGLIVVAQKRGVISKTQKSLFESIVAGATGRKAVDSVKESLTVLLQAEEEKLTNIGTPPSILPSSSWEVASQHEFQAIEPMLHTDANQPNEKSADGQEEETHIPEKFPAIYASNSREDSCQCERENIGTSSWEATASQTIEPCSKGQLGLELNCRLQLSPDESKARACTTEDSQQTNDDIGDDWGKWVGSGLAILGAVIGTVALHNTQQQQGGDDQTQRRRRDESTGNIVVISSEVEDDDWVSVSDS